MSGHDIALDLASLDQEARQRRPVHYPYRFRHGHPQLHDPAMAEAIRKLYQIGAPTSGSQSYEEGSSSTGNDEAAQ